MNGLKIVFLDLDGPDSVANLARIVNQPNVDIVISSSWKCLGLDYLQSMWKDRQLPGNVVDITPSETNRDVIRNASPADIRWLTSKGYEIQMWLQKNKGIESYAILDDENFILSNQQDHFVQIDPIVGITNEDVMRVNLILQQC